MDDDRNHHAEFLDDDDELVDLAMRLGMWLRETEEQDRRPIVPAAEIRAAVAQVQEATAACPYLERKLRAAYQAKRRGILRVRDLLRGRLWCAELKVRGRPERFSGFGWGGRPGATDREPPGAVRDVAVRWRSDSAAVLEWRPLRDGGPATEYWVQRKWPGGAWEDCARAVDNDCFLPYLTPGDEPQLRVYAVNRSGAGPASAPVTLAL